jgi:hypothetical protein
VLRELEESRELRSVDAWMQSVADALHAASYRRSGWYDPAVLGALHRILGNKQVSIDVSIAPPPWVENRLVGSRPLRARTHRTSHRLSHDPIDFDPQCTAALFEMLDTFPTADGSEVHWLPAAANSGAPCDGTRGDFAQ